MKKLKEFLLELQAPTTDNLNDSDLPKISVLVSFDVVNMFPSIDNDHV